MTNKKELLNKEPNAMKVLHNLFGYDFNSNYNIYREVEPFTINKILKKYKLEPYRQEIILLLYCKNWNRYHIVELEEFNTININIKPYNSGVKNNLDYFFRKSDYEETRKNNIDTFIIVQNRDLLKKAAEKYIDFSERVIVKDFTKCYNPTKDEHYISRINIKQNNNKFMYEPFKSFYTNEKRDDNIYSYIDKSGYVLRHRHLELKRRTQNLKAEKSKNKVDSIQWGETLNELNNKILKIKVFVSGEVLKPLKGRNLENIIHYLSVASEYTKDFEEYAIEKKFTSFECAENRINLINDYILKAEKIIEGMKQ